MRSAGVGEVTHGRALALAAAVALASTRTARADEPLRVAPPPCASLPFDWPAFEALLAVELRESGVTIAPVGVSALLVDVTACDASGATPVTLTFTGPPPRSRSVALFDVEVGVRPRVLALAAAEFVVASIPLRAAPDPTPTPTPTVVPAPVVTTMPPVSVAPLPPQPAPKPRMRPFTASVAFAMRAFPIDETVMTGLELRGSIRLTGLLRLRTAVVGLYARDDSPLGTAHLAGGAGAIGVSLGARGDVVGFDVGPRLDVGGMVIEGHAAPGAVSLSDDVVAPFVGLGLDAEADFWPTPGFFVVVGAEAGGALSGVTGNVGGARAIGASGPFFGLRLGLGIAP